MSGIGNKCYETPEEGEIWSGCMIKTVFTNVTGLELGLK